MSIVRTHLVRAASNLLRRSRVLMHWWRFSSSSSYWERRYRTGGTSGAGSYGRLAQFKADVLNAFVERERIRSIIEFGVGDGAQLELAKYPRYVGIDVARTSIDLCCRRFASDETKKFYLACQTPPDLGHFDLALSLDVIYHLTEDAVFEAHMRSLFASASRFVIIYSSNKLEKSNRPHVRHREFARWTTEHCPAWRLREQIENKYPFDPARPAETSFADFYFFERVDPNRNCLEHNC